MEGVSDFDTLISAVGDCANALKETTHFVGLGLIPNIGYSRNLPVSTLITGIAHLAMKADGKERLAALMEVTRFTIVRGKQERVQ